MSAFLHDSYLLIFAAACAIATVVAIVCVRLSLKRARARRFQGLELRPNCLLTRYPIVLLTQPKSLFRIFDQWNDVPKFLREHGYEVFLLTPLAGHEVKSILGAIEEMPMKCHLIASAADESLLEKVARSKCAKVSSLTVVKAKSAMPKKTELSVDALRPLDVAVETFEVEGFRRRSTPWAFEFQFLDYAVELAERDAQFCD
jgi:hypothetical protein